MDETSTKQRWQAHFHELLNEKGDKDTKLGDLARIESFRDWILQVFQDLRLDVILV